MENRIKEFREKRGWTQDAFARTFGVSQQTVSRIEQDTQSIKIDLLIKISNYFNVTTDYVLNLTDEKRNLLRENQASKKIDEYYDLIVEFEELDPMHQQIFRVLLRGLKEAQSLQEQPEQQNQ